MVCYYSSILGLCDVWSLGSTTWLDTDTNIFTFMYNHVALERDQKIRRTVLKKANCLVAYIFEISHSLCLCERFCGYGKVLVYLDDNLKWLWIVGTVSCRENLLLARSYAFLNIDLHWMYTRFPYKVLLHLICDLCSIFIDVPPHNNRYCLEYNNEKWIFFSICQYVERNTSLAE